MPHPKSPVPAELGDRFHVHAALAAGVSLRRLRNPDLEAPFRGMRRRRGDNHEPFDPVLDIRTSRDHTSAAHVNESHRRRHLDLARSYLLVAPVGTFLCGRTAACLHGLPIQISENSPIEVARFAPLSAPRGQGIQGTQVRQRLAAVVSVQGLPVTSVATSWGMLGSVLTLEELVVLGDAIVHERPSRRASPPTASVPASAPPLATLAELRSAASDYRRPGGPRLRAAHTLIRQESASRPETLLRLTLLQGGLPEPELNAEVRDSAGKLLGRSELVYRERRVAFEYESEHHRVDRRQWNRDIEKYQLYQEAGWQIVRITGRLLFSERRELLRQAWAAYGRAR